MAVKLGAVRGMRDLLPGQTAVWGPVERVMQQVAAQYGYTELRTPIVEKTALFERSIGEQTDIVEKEMYSFHSLGGEALTLRPEGTAGVVRAGVQHGMFRAGGHRVWYCGPMFRHERPQKGRYRQFQQFGIEAFGWTGPDMDAEILMLAARIWSGLGITGLQLQINTLGSEKTRVQFRAALVEYLQNQKNLLDEDSQRRLQCNPLRVLDSKNPAMQSIIAGAPQILDYLDDRSAAHFSQLRARLDAVGLVYTINPRLVRGLDYYTSTVFEWTTDRLGAQNAVCAGGRYDQLVAELGGGDVPATGFAIGLDRIMELIPDQQLKILSDTVDAYLVWLGDAACLHAPLVTETLRNAGVSVIAHCGGGGLKAQMKKADRSGARYALILGDEELERKSVMVKPLRQEGQQQCLTWSEAATFIRSHTPLPLVS